ncbi:5-dehydro-4-deoxy-D-glucuronate isomerase [Streptomyces sp. 891-h]|uniref:5-dehydro-4-deoxy-D-glucuronate isomerase n=1 Tax=Streptomyces sp. 891-h TaxID=2720714 RepID=UPI001FA9C870|nr:5-dehydro-4-deoxy-D-glucuronate isomerase [Streptomyces sp. 891-h]UNZ15846.1 5-dehydro-4-deoxy-D-glucuronate isomerase [Streptomyces sp. 891-h]
MEVRHTTGPDQVPGMDTEELRSRFLVQDLFGTDEVRTVYSHEDRMVIGGVRPSGATVPLLTADPLRADHFLARRELGVVNVGSGPGTVTADGTEHQLGTKEVLYVGRGTREVAFTGDGSAAFYVVSTPAHATHPTRKGGLQDATPVHLGEQRTSNERTIYKFIHADGIQSCQLVLGITELGEGSMWNTMPAHTHDRRTEMYLYFGLDPDQRVVHLMGRPDQTRNLIVAGEQAVISPSWSVHCGFGTGSYAFVWAMGGENTDYTDVEPFPITELR